MADISELDQEAQRLRVEWKKAQNYYNTFIQDFFRMKDAFDGSRYDHNAPHPFKRDKGEWSFSVWLLFKCGLLETQVLRRAKLFADAMAADERDRMDAERRQRAQANRAEREVKSQAYQARRAERKVAQTEKETQRKREAKRKATSKAKAAPKANSDASLAALTEQVRAAQEGCELALQFETVESRREKVVAYGRALLALRKAMPSNEQFGQHLAQHGLNYRSAQFRSDTMWLAENHAFLMNSLRTCVYANPMDIRNWWRGQQDQQRSKANGKADHASP